MRAIPLNLVVVSTLGLSIVTSCAPEPKGSDTTKDSSEKSSDSTTVDLDTDELTGEDVQQIAFSFNGVEYFNQWWTDENYATTEMINEDAQPGDILLYMNLTDYTAGSGTWSVTDVEAGTTHPLFEITASGSAYPRLSIRELDATSGAIGDHGSLTSLGQGDETYVAFIRQAFGSTVYAYCKSIVGGSENVNRECGSCVGVDGAPYTDALGYQISPNNRVCDNANQHFGAKISYNDGSTDYEQIVWWEVASRPAAIVNNLTNLNDGSTGGLSYDNTDETAVLSLNTNHDAEYNADYDNDGDDDLRFNDNNARSSSVRARLYGCTTSDLLYVENAVGWSVTNTDTRLRFDGQDEIRLSYSPSLTGGSAWSGGSVSTYPVFDTPVSDQMGDYCQIDFAFRRDADNIISSNESIAYLDGGDYVRALLRTLTYRYSDTGSGIVNEGLRTIQISLRDERDDSSPQFATASKPAEIDIAVYNNPTLTDATTATFFDGTPDVIVNVDYDTELTVGGTYADGDPCYIASGTVVASTDTTITFSKANGDDLPEGSHTCTLTPVRTVTPTRVTDGETTSFDFTGDVVTFSLTVDTTAPIITIDSEIADLNGYTTSTTPSFAVTSDEAGTLTVGGSCTITGQDAISASSSTTITLDALTEGSTYSDCTVTVTDAAGNPSNVETLNAFTVDTTAPTVTIDSEVADSNGYTTTLTPSFAVTSDEAGTLTVGGSCTITGQDAISASSSTTITLDALTEGSTYSDCTVTVTDAAGNNASVALSSFTADTIAPVITIDTEIANANGYTNSLTPSFAVTSGEAGTLTVGGSCTITGQDAISASSSTTITLDALTEGSTYSDCTVTVTDAAGLASNIETLSSFIPDVTSPTMTVALSSPLSTNANVTESTTPDVLISLAATESDTTIAVDAASTTDCALSSSTLTGGGVSNTITVTHPSTTTFSDGQIVCQVDLVDLAGNTADETISFYVDQNAPVISIASQPSTPTLLPTFSLDTDEDGTLSLMGDCSEGSALVSGSSSISDTSSGSAAVVTITGLTEATYYTCKVVVTDVAGRTSSASLDEFVIDTTSDAPVITGIANDNGLSSSDLITNDGAVVFTGTAEANAEVTLTIDDGSASVECVTTADGTGTWTCDASTSGSDTYASDLGAAGTSVDYTITATAIDGLSNPASASSNALAITVDQEAPTLTVGVIGTAGVTESSNPSVTLTSDQAVLSAFQVGVDAADDCALATYTELADATSGNSFILSHETDGGFVDNTGSSYSCTAAVTDIAGNVSTQENFTFTVTQAGVVISQSAPADASVGSGSVTSNTAPVVKIFSNTLIDPLGDATHSITLAGGCETTTASLAENAETEVVLTATGGAAFTDGVYSCTLTVNDGTADSNVLTLDDFTIDGTAPTISVTDVDSNVTTSISIAENAEVGATVATVTGSDTYATTLTYTEDAAGDAVANAALEIDAATGVVSLSTTVTLGTTYTYSVVVADDALPTNNEATETITFTVTEANVAPVLDDTYVANFAAISEHIVDGDNLGQAVSTLLTDGSTSSITDTNTTSVEGIAVYDATVSGASEWQYKDATGNWTALPAVTANSVFLLSSADELRYVPSVLNGETGTLSFFAWDQTDGAQYDTAAVTARGGATAYSTADATVSITVNDANDPPTMTAATTTLTGITEGDTSTVILNTYASSLISDDDTASGFDTLGLAITGFTETEAGSWQYSTDAGSTWSNFSDLAAVSETAAFLMDASDANGQIRFVSNTSNGETTTLDFYAWDQSSGTAGTQVDITAEYADVDSAYSASGSTNTFSLTVIDENDAPVLASSIANFSDISENDTANNGELVSTLLNGQLSDVDTVSAQGIAIHTTSAGNGSWEYSTDSGTTWTTFPAVSSAGALVLTDTDSVRFVPSNDNADSASISYYGWDQSDAATAGTTVDVSTVGGSTAFSLDSVTSTITVNDVNDQPVLDITTSPVTLTTINEGDSDAISYSASVLISSEIGSTISDSDTGDLKGIAITDASSSNGYWEYSVDSEATWTEITGASTTTALLLDESAYLRFASTGPDGVTATLTFYAWDQTDGTASGSIGDTTASFTPSTISPFSVDSNNLSLEVTDLNDAPELAGATTSLTAITEDDANSSEDDVSTFELATALTGLITDTDTTSGFAETGIAVTGVSTTNGRWDYSIDSEVTWTEITGVSSTDVLVLDSSAFVRFIPDSTNGTTATLTFLAWDQSDSSTNGTIVTISSANQGDAGAYSLAQDTFSLEVTSVNDRPVFADTTDVVLTPEISEGETSTGYNLYTILDPSTTITDADDATLATIGVAVTAASSTEGEWEYSTDSGTTWTSFNDASVSTGTALLFDISSVGVAPEVRFNAAAGENGVTASLEVYAWDETQTPNPADVATLNSSDGVASTFSSDTRNITLVVNAINDQPVLDITTSPIVMTAINEGDSDAISYSASVLISSEIGSTISDSDTGDLKGIAITDASSSNGYWEYSVDSEATWTEITGASATAALLLDESAYLRFASTGPDGVTATLTFYAWDQSAGTAEGTADTTTVYTPSTLSPFSADSNSLSLEVTDLNDAPELAGITTSLGSITENDADNSEGDVTTFDLSSLVTSLITDTDTTSAFNTLGIAVTGVSTTNGRWDYSIDSETTWTEITGVSSTDVLVLDSSAFVRFIPDSTNGTTATLTFLAWDQSDASTNGTIVTISSANQGDAGAYSLAQDTLSLEVTDENDRPILDITTSPITLTTINEGDADSIIYSEAVIISDTISPTITEIDSGDSKGIAITDASNSNGYWEYSVDTGSNWTQISGVTTTTALLLDESAYLRFASTGPDGVTATLEFYAWDQTDGNLSEVNADTTTTVIPITNDYFSADSNTLSLEVTDLNDAPELVDGVTLDLGTITEDDAPAGDAPVYSALTTYQVSSVVTSSVYTDTDTTNAFNNVGIAVNSVSTTNGRWEYSKDGGVTWETVPAVSSSLILLLDDTDYLRFVPNGQNGTTATLTFLGWDQSNSPTIASDNTTSLTPSEQGDAGAYSLFANTMSLTVDSINDAPVFSTTGTTTLTAITEDDVGNAGQLVSDVLLDSSAANRVSDVDDGAVFGIAVSGITSGVGTWQFNLNDGSGWQDVETGSAISTSNARLIPSDANIRFNPNSAAENGEVVDPTITYVAWDQTSGSAGGFTSVATTGDTTAYSVNSETASIAVSSLNDAPVIASVTNFTTITEDDNQASTPTNYAQLSSLISVTDVDTSAPNDGIAIVAQTATNGVWKYSLDTLTWGTISISTGALVLDLDDYIAFVPNGENGGTSTLEFHAWDQYSDTTAPTPGTNTSIASTGGTAAFSSATETIEILVTQVNDAPVWPVATTGADFTEITEDEINNAGDVISDLLALQDTDVDAGSTRGIAVYNATLGSNGTGNWEYSTDAGSTWAPMGSVTSSAALLLRASDYLRFVPDGDNGEATNPYIDFYLWDGNPAFTGTTADVSVRGGTDSTANFSEESARSEIVVTDVNDTPVLTALGMVYDEGETIVRLNTTDVVGNNADITIEEVDIGDTLTVELSLSATNWPFDPSAPDGTSTRTFVENNTVVTLDVVDTYGGTLSTGSTAWDDTTNTLTLTGDVASINAELQSLIFTPTAGLTPTDSGTVGAPDFDLDSVIGITVTDASNTTDSENVAFTVQNSWNDRPVAVVYWDAYEDQTAATNEDQTKLVTELQPTSPADGVYIRVDADMSWDPDDQDDVVSYTFTPDEPITANCGGTPQLLTSTTGCTLTNGTDYITHPARTADITWTVSVEDSNSQTNTVSDLHDQVTVSIANQPPEVTVYLASDVAECSRAHATGNNNPVYADEDLDCFCDEVVCDDNPNTGPNSPTCVDSDGLECSPTMSATFTECAPLSAVYGDDNRGTDTACYCEEMDCDGFDSAGEENCFDLDGLACVPSTNNIDACVPTVAPNDFDFPYDVNLDLVACTYDANGDALNFNWSLSTPPALGTASFTTSGNTAVLSIAPPDIGGTPGYFQDDELNLELEVSDLEDTVVRTADMNFCAGWFPDSDEDGYGATTAYQANCANTVSATFVDPIPANSNISVVQGADYQGLDCLDEGVLSDDETLYGNLASTTQLSAVDIQDRVFWYIDYDNDGYGAMTGGRGDNGSAQFELTDGAGAVTDTMDIVYVDPVYACVLDNPSVTLSTGETKNYLLNNDDCNDILDFSDGVYTESPASGGLGASNQNPETTWYADIDGDGYAMAGSTDTSANFVYPDADFDCLCTSASGACSSVVNNYQLVTGVTSSTCIKTGSLYSYKVEYQQCESPTEAGNTQNITGLPVSWVLNNTSGYGDCDETNASINEGAQEACDENDIDEDCDGLADDNDNNGTVSGALTFFVDNDGDGSPTSVGKVFSCDGNTSSGASSLVYYYILPANNTTFLDSNVSGQCICPTDQCNEACRLSSDSTKACYPTNNQAFTNGTSYCAGVTNTSGVFSYTKTPFDFTASTFTDFALYVKDCNDNSAAVYPRAEEACDGVLNDCVNSAGGVPSDEVDFDNDGYVECEFDGSTWNGSNVPLVGADCSPRDTNVYPNATNICDGQYNNCASWRDTYVDTSRECFCYDVDANDPSLCDTTSCVDNTGASCTPAFDSQGLQSCSVWADVTERYVDETGACYCDGATNQGLCDSDICHTAEGVVCTPADTDNDGLASCSEIEFDNKMSPGAPANQIDNDGDCFVECFDGSTSWVGGTALLGSSCSTINEGQDCNDTSSFVYPGAIEVCDGQFNNCDSPSFSATGAPVTETDDDGDGFVECEDGEYMDLSGCRCESATDDGSGNLTFNNCINSRGQVCVPDSTISPVTWVIGTTGYGDCADLDDTRYPGAPEICDGLFNNCDNPLLDNYVGASGEDCYCANSDGTGCVDSSGLSCSVDTNVVDLVQLSNAVLVGATPLLYQEVECYCSTSDCQIDVDGDGSSDCLDENNDPCAPTDADNDGYADSCITDPLEISTGTALSQSMFSLTSAPGRETDNDGDNYVECNYTASLWVGDPYVVGGQDCNDFPTDNGDRVYPNAPEHCDGVYNDCLDATYSPNTPPTVESDVDGDGFVECSLTAGFDWIGVVQPDGYADCVDTNRLIYPNAVEVCDGVFNDCLASGYNVASAPSSESDVDGDGYVECADVYYADAAGCVCEGTTAANGVVSYANCLYQQSACTPDLASIAQLSWQGSAITGYEDCDDAVATIYPNASEVCDGRFNDCDHPLKPDGDNAGVYTGVVGECFCPVVDTTGDGTADSCDATQCEDASGNSCAPADENQDGYVDDCVIADNSASAFATASTGTALYGAEVDCYCPSEDCQLDVTGDAVNDCYAPDGSECQALSDNNGFARECLSNLGSTTVSVAHVFVDDNGTQVSQPWAEIDNDGDGYVECTEFDLQTYRAGGGSFSVVGGLDCDDYDSVVYPTATEYCDGQFNDCEAVAYTSTGAPENEVDNDGDGYVECELTTGVPWGNAATEPVGYADCDDASDLIYPTARELCDGVFNDCGVANYDPTGAPVLEVDGDGDGFVDCFDGAYIDENNCLCATTADTNEDGIVDLFEDCTDDNGAQCTPDNASLEAVVWLGAVSPAGYGDCNDVRPTVYPGAEEVCDAQFNNCDDPLNPINPDTNGVYTGVVGDCFCPSTDCAIDGDGDGNSDCVDSTGNACSPVDEDQDGFADECAESTVAINISGLDYFSVEADCYCPEETCGYDWNGDITSRCYTPSGASCTQPLDLNNNYVDCASAPAGMAGVFTHEFVDANGNPITKPFDEIDNDGDKYVECEGFDPVAWNAAGGSVQVLGGEDCDDVDNRVYPNAPEYCDGQFNDCTDVAYDPVLAPEVETDNDGDGYVECELTTGVPWAIAATDPMGDGSNYTDGFGCYCDGPCDDTGSICTDYGGSVCNPIVSTCSPVGGYADCDDTDTWVFPSAPDLCDGQYNDCSDNSFSLVDIPSDEADLDGDGYVECVEDGSIWAGQDIPVGYGDCSDDDSTTNGSAEEICDGIFNDCAHPQKFPFEGVVGDCYCPSTDCAIDGDGDGTSDCMDSTGNTCTPADEDQDGFADYCNESTTPVSIAGTDFFGVEVECYCPTSDCQIDVNGDGETDCYTPTGDVCSISDDGSGVAQDCAYGDQIPFIFTNKDGNPLTAPMNETDNDGDGFVECEYFADVWIGVAGDGVVGGDDCNDGDDLVYPNATEYCDGQYNNCSDLTHDINGAPATESDIDGDGYVECSFTAGIEWARNEVPVGDEDCNDNNATVYPGATEVCDGLYNNCTVFGYDPNLAPADETDNDGDGYVECLDGQMVDPNGCACDSATDTDSDGIPDVFVGCVDSSGVVCTPVADALIAVTWGGIDTPTGYGDCDDVNLAKYPDAVEECDGIFNNCDHPQKSAFEGVVGDCYCPTTDTDGDGSDDACSTTGCLDAAGNTCTPVDEDQDGYVDPAYCAISSTSVTVAGTAFFGAEVDCYCPSDDCQLDVLGNGSSDCLTPEGETCVPADTQVVGFADQCLTGANGLTIEHTFENENGGNLTRPFNETDNDGDGFVECEYINAAWLGSLSVVGGFDCDDYDNAVYPSAAEVCDGQFNDCSNNYVETSAPADELDDDNDGWVECVRDLDVAWNAFDGSQEPNAMGYGTDGTALGSSFCICSDSACSTNCIDEVGNSCVVPVGECERQISYTDGDCDDADGYTHPFVALKEYSEAGDGVSAASCVRDRDGDGYGDSAPTIAGVTAGHDCDDLNLYVHPKQNEVCEAGDQIDSDCNGNVNTADYSEGYILDTNGLGSLLYVDNDGDGFGDSSIAATPACEVAEGFVFNATDCDDEDSTINPNSKEICDGIDQDCDLTIDEPDSLDDPSISKCTYMYRDVDADFYGDVDYTQCLCQEGSDPSVTYGEYEYVIYSGDCYDFNADIKPLTCADGIDQDDDGLVDDEDPDCIAGYQEGSDTIKEEAFELLDGHDNNCDGLVAAVELDCDDDGSFPLVPGESGSFNRSETFQMAADIGLEACSGLSTTFECWGEQQRLVCDTLTAELNDGVIEYNGTGLWMLNISESDDGYGGRFDGGHREYPMGRTCGASRGDCDDQCPDRCPDQIETCDGIDNDCSQTSPGTDGDASDTFAGIPDAMIAANPIEGTISDTEIDIDSDGYLSCASFTSAGDQNQWSDASCDTVSGVNDDNDCNNYCFFSSPNADERCDAFQGTCGGDNLDGTDADGDDMLTCGAWGTDETLTEDIYVVVWMKDVDWSQLASEEQELMRPVRTADDIEWVLAQRDTADTADQDGDTGDTGWVDSESTQETENQRLVRERRQFINERMPILNTNGGFIEGDVDADMLERMIPLVSPRALAPYCDSYLQDQLTLLLGFENMEALRQMDSAEDQADILLQACDSEIEGVAGCGIVRLSLSRTTDDETYEYLDAIQSEILSFPTECEERTEEWISRSMWQRDRIVEARTITVEWECHRMYGKPCNEISDQTKLIDGWESSMISAERWLDIDRSWFKEIGRYNPEAISGGTMMSCWGDPTDPTASFNEQVGGDCADDDSAAHRDNPEGPGDLVGLYLYGDMADCDTCLDGIDNNCDGAIDCADPACAPCFVGQGVGCGGGSDSPCAQGGCASPDQSGKERMYRSLGLIMMAMIISIIRRRETRSAA